MNTKEILKENPRVYNSQDIETLDKAYEVMLKTFDEYASTHQLPEEQKFKFHELLNETYMERKMSLFLKPRVANISKRINVSIRRAFTDIDPEKERPGNPFLTKVIYYKNNKSIISNEPF